MHVGTQSVNSSNFLIYPRKINTLSKHFKYIEILELLEKDIFLFHFFVTMRYKMRETRIREKSRDVMIACSHNTSNYNSNFYFTSICEYRAAYPLLQGRIIGK